MTLRWYSLLLPLMIVACSEAPEPSTTAQTPPSAASETAADPGPAPLAQLPKGVTPTRYRLDFTIIPDQSHFSGHAQIDVNLAEASNHIWMHGLDLEVSKASVTPQGRPAIEAKYQQVDDHGVAALSLADTAAAGPAVIQIEYRAPFNAGLAGLYKVEEDGQAYAFSQMEAIDARRAFPGFDEPAFKTPYDVTITTRSDYQAFTNAKATQVREHEDGLKTVTYATTPPLPTYLIAFSIGPLDLVTWEPVPATAIRPEPLQLRGIAPKGKGDKIAYALEHTADLVLTLEDYFGSPYPYDKLDIVAVPDFRAGAMENAGLILYREPLLLLDEDPSIRQQRSYAGVHAHELAHQWFGNLVTMPWWDDIWLNESFATWMGNKAVHLWRPEYFFDRNIQGGALGAMTNDSLLSARQIREPVDTNADIENAFDGITYSKGGGVLSMFESWLGEDTFRLGIQQHMKRFAHGNATVFDFIQSLAAVAPDKEIDKAFRSFLFQPGVPFVQVEIDCSGDAALAKLSQQRYLPWGTEETEQRRWAVPVCMSYGGDNQVREQCVLLDSAEKTVELGSALACPDWIMPNRNGAGYYRFGLGGEGMQALAAAADDHLNAREKIAFADSLEAAVLNGSLDAETFLQAMPDLVNSVERAVALAPIGTFGAMMEDYLNEEERARAQAWGREILARRLARLDSPGGSESAMEAKLLRTSLLRFLALSVEDPGVRADMKAAGHAFLGWGGDGEVDRDAIDPDLLSTALGVAGEEADQAFYEHMLTHFKRSTDGRVRGALLSGISRVKNPQLQARSLQMVFDEGLRVNEIPSLMFGGMVRHNREATWQWFQANFDAILSHLPDRFRNFAPRIGSSFCDQTKRQELLALFEPHMADMPGAQRALDQSLEYIAQCSALREKQAASAKRFFSGLERQTAAP